MPVQSPNLVMKQLHRITNHIFTDIYILSESYKQKKYFRCNLFLENKSKYIFNIEE